MQNKPIKRSLFLNMVLAMFASYLLTFILHGWAHNWLARWYGLGSHLWALDIHSLWLQNVTENSGLAELSQLGGYYTIGIIGFASCLINWALLALALTQINSSKPGDKGITFYYWLFVWNLSLNFNYIPHFLFSAGNLGKTFDDLGVSSMWLAYIVSAAGSIIMCCILFFFLIQQTCSKLNISNLLHRRIYFVISLIIVIYYNGLRYGWSHGGIIFSSAGLFIWIKLLVVIILCYTVNLNKAQN